MIKLVVSDIDGTLVADGTTDMNPKIYEEILRLRKKGIQVAIATGRHWSSLESVFNPIKDKIFYISDNGAYLGMSGRTLFINSMDREKSYNVLDAIQGYKELVAVAATKDGYLIDKDEPELIEWIRIGYKGKVEKVDSLLASDIEIMKISAYAKDSIYQYIDLKKKFENDLDVMFAGHHWLDFTSHGVSKGNAVKILQKALQITEKETMAFGDQGNDIEMLKSAYYSFAMGNATEETKSVAKFEADTNLNDGVLKILRYI